MPLVDFIVTRKDSDPTGYRDIVKRCPDVRLIEAPYVPNSFIQARLNMLNYGDSEYIGWFDPDDLLYVYSLQFMVDAIKANPSEIGAIMLCDYEIKGVRKQSSFKDFRSRPVHGHLLRIVKRKWLEDNIRYLRSPVPEWPLTAKIIEDGAVMIPISGYCWMVGDGDHCRITTDDIAISRLEVNEILGSKYQKLVKEIYK